MRVHRVAARLAAAMLFLGTPGPAVPQTSEPDRLALRADSLVAADRPLRAARLLAPALAAAGRDADEGLVLAAARAWTAARAWRTVDRLLAERAWSGEASAAEAGRLRGLARLELGDAEGALARLDDAADSPDAALATLAGRARALERLGRDAEAAGAWLEAARARPEIGGWLRLSALQALGRTALADSAARVAAAALADRALSRDSVRLEVARAAFRAGDTARALATVDSLGAGTAATLAGEWTIPVLLARGDTVAAARAARRALETGRADAAAGETLFALDTTLASLRLVAATDLAAGRARRAVELLERVLAEAPEAERPAIRLELAETWFARRRYAETRTALAPWLDAPAGADAAADPAASGASAAPSVSEPPGAQRRRAAALFLAGRSWYRQGRTEEALALWRRVAELAAAADGPYAAFLVADILHDRGDLAGAAAAYQRTLDLHPSSSYASTAAFRLGMLAMLEERPVDAVRRFALVPRRWPGGNWHHAALYWTGRARAAAGDSVAARTAWRAAVDYDPLGYYALLAARALGIDPWDHVPRRAASPAPPPRPTDLALVERLDLLRVLGWRARAVRELSTRERTGESAPARLALALLLNERGWSWQGTALADAVRRQGGGAWTDDLLRGVYPLVYGEPLREVAVRRRLDPALVAALVRRESQFDREVTSPAEAIGLMQILPRTGAELARRAGVSDFSADRLRVAELNLELGTLYLRDLLDRNGGALPAALISYNAGPHRWARWRSFPEFSADAELLVERIPFSETRVYVKTIQAYRHIYRRLWGLGAAPAKASADPADAVPAAGP
ncbi:MAG: transglycosylase SLT domain-containing protein [Gemmatimonadota bacterium]|nr:transglycosylase SLT domain-containing protein [Gemmatimonadota bacterium]